LSTLQICESLNHPTVYNADETPIPVNPKPPRKVAIKGKICQSKQAEDRRNITALVTIASDGKIITPLLIFPNKMDWNNKKP